MTARIAFKKMLEICFEEDFPRLHCELVSLEQEAKRERKSTKYESSMDNIFDLISVLAEELSSDAYQKLQIIYEEYFDNKI
jgi:hypothetical protein